MAWLVELAGNLYQGLTAPLNFAFQPSSRLFWLFWLSSAIMAGAALYLEHRQRYNQKGSGRNENANPLQPFCKHLLGAFFSPSYWLSRSTLVDISYLFGNSLLKAAIIVPLVGSHLVATLFVARWLQSQFGNAPVTDLPWLAIAVLFTISFFVLEDFSRFALHRVMHRVPFLWRFHKIHHSATRLTPLTLHRVHPVEMTLYYGRGILVFGLVSGVFVYLFGAKLSGLDVLGVDALGFAFNFLGANLRHSHIWLSFGPLERWLISPAQHQIHHSRAPQHRNKNFGTCLAIWDRLFGTNMPAGTHKQRLRFGVRA